MGPETVRPSINDWYCTIYDGTKVGAEVVCDKCFDINLILCLASTTLGLRSGAI